MLHGAEIQTPMAIGSHLLAVPIEKACWLVAVWGLCRRARVGGTVVASWGRPEQPAGSEGARRSGFPTERAVGLALSGRWQRPCGWEGGTNERGNPINDVGSLI
jgi:hypothetical protein